MPRHAFKFPPEVLEAVREHVRRALEGVNPRRYNQESPYTTALANRLEGRAYQGRYGTVDFESTVVDDRGANSAESVYGADLAITATVSDGNRTIRKAILIQAKLGRIDELSPSGRAALDEQIKKMRKLVDAPKVMQITDSGVQRVPQIISGNNVLNGAPFTPMNLEDYFVARVMTTLDGCTDPDVVIQVQDSTLTRVHVAAKLAEKP